MDSLDEWLARVTVAIGIAVAISKESRSWYKVLKEQNILFVAILAIAIAWYSGDNKK